MAWDEIFDGIIWDEAKGRYRGSGTPEKKEHICDIYYDRMDKGNIYKVEDDSGKNNPNDHNWSMVQAKNVYKSMFGAAAGASNTVSSELTMPITKKGLKTDGWLYVSIPGNTWTYMTPNMLWVSLVTYRNDLYADEILWDWVLNLWPFQDAGGKYGSPEDKYSSRKWSCTSTAMQAAANAGVEGENGYWDNDKDLIDAAYGHDSKGNISSAEGLSPKNIICKQRMKFNDSSVYVLHPLMCAGDTSGNFAKNSIYSAFASYILGDDTGFDGSGNEKKIIYKSEGHIDAEESYKNMTTAECCLYYMMCNGTEEDTKIHHRTTYKYVVNGMNSPDSSPIGTLVGDDSRGRIQNLFSGGHDKDSPSLKDKCKALFQDVRTQSETNGPGKGSDRDPAIALPYIFDANKETMKLALGGDDITNVKTFAKYVTWGNDNLKEIGGHAQLGLQDWLTWLSEDADRREAYTTWGCFKDPSPAKSNPPVAGYHLWGSYCMHYQKYRLPENDYARYGVAGEDEELPIDSKQHQPTTPAYRRLYYAYGEPFRNNDSGTGAKGRQAIFRAWGKFKDSEGNFSDEEGAESGVIPERYHSAIEKAGIPFFNTDGTWPANAIKNTHSEEAAKYPVDLDKSTWDWINEDWAPPIVRVVTCKNPDQSAKIHEPQRGKVVSNALTGDEYGPRYTMSADQVKFLGLQKPRTVLDWSGDLPQWSEQSSNRGEGEGRKAEFLRATKSESDESRKAMMEAILERADAVPEFKALYHPFKNMENIINEIHAAFVARLSQDPSEWGPIGGPGQDDYGSAKMLASYVRQASFACGRWYQWIKANNNIVWMWYALIFKIGSDPNITAEDLEKWIGENKEKIVEESNTNMEEVQDAAAELEDARKKKLREARQTAAGAKGDAEKAKEAQREREKFAGQCSLLANMEVLKKKYQKIIQEELKDEKNTLVHDKQAYGGRFHLLNDSEKEHSKVPSYLSAPKKDAIKLFTQITPDIISSLTPKIRLFKVYADDRVKGGLREVEFAFENFQNHNVDTYMKEEVDKGHGAGIKSFTFSFDGTTPATARKDIKAELTLYFQNFNDLIKKRKFAAGYPEYSYVELLLLPFTEQKDPRHTHDYRAEDYRIRADVGWSERTDEAFKQILEKRCANDPLFKDIENPLDGFNKSLQKINKSFYLNMIDHDLDIKNDGTVELKVTYAAYIESMMKSNTLNALSTPETVYLAKQRQRKLDELIFSNNCTSAQLKLMKEYNAQQDQAHVKGMYASIKRRLIQRRKIFFVDITPSQVKSFVKRGVLPVIGNDRIGMANSKDWTYVDDRLNESRSQDGGNERVNFFFLGDLLHTILDCMYEPAHTPDEKVYDPYTAKLNTGEIRPELSNTKLLLGGFVYDDYFADKKQNVFHDINISEIPISMDWFQKWMTENIVEQERTVYPAMDFVRDISQMLINIFLETCINKQVDKAISLETGQLLAISDGYGDPLFHLKEANMKAPMGMSPKQEKTYQKNKKQFAHIDYMINANLRHKEGLLPLTTASPSAHVSDFYNYIFLYPITSMNTSYHKGKGIRKEDEDNGIYHYQIGSNRGLLKKIKFNKTDMQYIREARFFNHGSDGLMQLSAVYKINMEMIGNTIYYPGMEVFIDPRGFGGPEFDPTNGQKIAKTAGGDKKILTPASVANALGIGGYHIVTKVKHTITPEGFKTVVEAQFHYSGDGKNSLLASKGKKREELKTIDQPSADDIKKCDKVVKQAEIDYINAITPPD